MGSGQNLHLLTRAGSVMGMRAGSGTKLARTLTLHMYTSDKDQTSQSQGTTVIQQKRL